MNATKIRLSAKEEALIGNTDFILTKNEISSKVNQLLGNIAAGQLKVIQRYPIATEILKVSPKIAKGENYKGLPWQMLDFPRLFDKENVLAIRTLFWWGNFFSITLQLAGKYKLMYENNIGSHYNSLKKENYFICISENPWEHHFEQNNYKPVTETEKQEFEKLLLKNDFLKLSTFFPLTVWNDAEDKLLSQFQFLLALISNNKAETKMI